MTDKVCLVDVEPQSLFGVSCGRTLVAGHGCPVHGFETEPRVLFRSSPDPEDVMEALFDLAREGH